MPLSFQLQVVKVVFRIIIDNNHKKYFDREVNFLMIKFLREFHCRHKKKSEKIANIRSRNLPL